MALGDFRHVRGAKTVVKKWVKAGAAESIKAGEPVLLNAGGDIEYVMLAAGDIDDTLLGTNPFYGIAETNSTDTVGADGFVYVCLPSVTTVLRGQAHTPANLTKDVVNTKVVLDTTGGVWKVDENLTTNGVAYIVGYDEEQKTWVDFIVDPSFYAIA
jgi:hypothetical protein